MRAHSLFLKCHERFKNGKEHRYWSLAENHRCVGGRMVQRQVLYLGEINDTQRQAWIKQIEVFDAGAQVFTTVALFPVDRVIPAEVTRGIQIELNEFEVELARQWGACCVVPEDQWAGPGLPQVPSRLGKRLACYFRLAIDSKAIRGTAAQD